MASSYGGARNGMVIHWPKGIAAKGEVRSQWHHVIDIAPTMWEAAGLPEPKSVNGTPQKPIEGVSMGYTFADAKAPSRHTTQYFEILGNCAIYKDGWLAGTVHRAAWEFKPGRSLEDDVWELYDARTDFSLANDLAAQNPQKLKEMRDLFMTEAVKYSVLPLDDRTLERLNAALVGRPDLMVGHFLDSLSGDDRHVGECLHQREEPVAHNHSRRGGSAGLLAQAGRFGGWSLYLKDGKPIYTYNWLGLKQYTIAGGQALPTGKATIRYEFVYDGGGVGKGGTGTLYVNGKNVATGRIDQTQCCAFSADEGADEGTPVTEDYQMPFKFTGKIDKVTIDLKEMTQSAAIETGKARQEAILKRALSDQAQRPRTDARCLLPIFQNARP